MAEHPCVQHSADAACCRFSLRGFGEGHSLAGLDLLRKAPDEDTQQGDLIPEDDALGGLKAPAFGEGEVFGVKAVLDRTPMCAALR